MPENTEEFVEYLMSIDRLDEAAVKMADIVNDVRNPHSLTLGAHAVLGL